MAIKNPRFDQLFRKEKIAEVENAFDNALQNEILKTKFGRVFYLEFNEYPLVFELYAGLSDLERKELKRRYINSGWNNIVYAKHSVYIEREDSFEMAEYFCFEG